MRLSEKCQANIEHLRDHDNLAFHQLRMAAYVRVCCVTQVKMSWPGAARKIRGMRKSFRLGGEKIPALRCTVRACCSCLIFNLNISFVFHP